MGTWALVAFVYGLLCVLIGLFKPTFIFKMKKFEVMKDMFGGEGRVQIFVLVWGALFVILGLFVIQV
jgi:hypothetical protein